MKRAVVAFFFLVLFASVAEAQQCVVCETVSCTNRVGEIVSATQCPSSGGTFPPGNGVKSCKTVANCGGCGGFSCIIRDPITLTRDQQPRLVPRKTTIRVIPAKNDR